ncbi:AP2-like ethylene-responsive transcription factor [Chloropicon primus]|uniref:AP2-like ethylene-responsive transcription factor n=2 Tax=Chloropicon primus TaxID=1764295 RepID=A0A5B8ML66_9CHLO|nr:AP2-like ethylene-responsive transcription factor [Chloropicon primus]|eukprot:QDZ21216.1 AP2-like ethylene-responsive transcription factor [Chloropicon primus]
MLRGCDGLLSPPEAKGGAAAAAASAASLEDDGGLMMDMFMIKDKNGEEMFDTSEIDFYDLLGLDEYDLDESSPNNASSRSLGSSYGHSDYTGASPQQEPRDNNNDNSAPTLKFREFQRPVSASYYRTQSFAAGQATWREDLELDYLQSSPPRPTRSLSCPESHASGQDSIFVYEDPLQAAFRGPGAGPGQPGGNPRALRDHSVDGSSTMMSQYNAYLQQYPGYAGEGELRIHKGTVIAPPGGAPAAKAKAKGKPKSSASAAAAAAEKKEKKKKAPARSRSSRFRGVTKHRRSGRWEAHIWVRETGKQVYLGGYEREDHAAEAFDVAALKCKGSKAKINFEIQKYEELLKYIHTITLDELVMAVRRQSQGFARGSSKFRGVTRHPNGRWEARIGMPGSKHIYLGLFNEEQEAARAYDRALVKLRGGQAATNFSLSNYNEQLKEYHLDQHQGILANSTAAKSAAAAGAPPSSKGDAAKASNTTQAAEISLSKTIADHAAKCI